ncbi:MAG TPA: hypothetical protein VHO91_20415 [Rhodopila sp.]|nr:hypothetical protein [Rhodopila sp.]
MLPLASGGCNVKITFADRGVVTAIGQGQIVRLRSIPTKRIARQYEITIRHDGGFESSYSITDLTPHASQDDPTRLRSAKSQVNQGDTLYDIVNGGYLHFQLSHAGKLTDPRDFMSAMPRHEG